MRNASLYHKATVFRTVLQFTAYKCEKFHYANSNIWYENKHLLKSTEVKKAPWKASEFYTAKVCELLNPFFSFLFMLTCVQDIAPRASNQTFSFFAVFRAVRFWSDTKVPKGSPNTHYNKSREKLILRTVHLWLAHKMDFLLLLNPLGSGGNCLKTWKVLHTPTVLCKAQC